MKAILSISLFFFISIGLYLTQNISKHPNSELELKKTVTKSFKKPDKDAKIFWYQYIEEGGIPYLVCGFEYAFGGYNRALAVYDFKNQNLCKIINFPPYIKNRSILAFKYINKDSILIETSYTENKGLMADSTWILLNDRGNAVVYNVDSLPINTIHNGIKMENSHYPLTTHPLGEIPYYKGKAYLETRKSVLGLDTSLIHSPQMGIYDLNNTSFKSIPLYHYPKQVYNYFWGENHIATNHILGLENQVLAVYGYSPFILEYDEKANNFTNHYAPSSFIDTIKPLCKKWDGNASNAVQYSLDVGNYNILLCDKYRNRYLRWMQLPRPQKGNMLERNKQRRGLMILDRDFRILGESDITEEKIKVVGVCKEGLMAVPERETSVDDFTVYVYDIKPTINKVNAKKETEVGMEKEDFAKYITDNFSEIPKNEETLIIPIPIGMSCGPCVNELLSYLKTQTKTPNYENISPIIVFESENIANQYLKTDTVINHLENVKVDKKGKLYHYLLSFWNPKLYWMKNGKIKKQMGLQPDNLIQAEMLISEFCTKKNK